LTKFLLVFALNQKRTKNGPGRAAVKKKRATLRWNFTERRLAALARPDHRQRLYDVEVRKLGLKLEATGKKTFFWADFVPAVNQPRRAGRAVWKTIGSWPEISLADARGKAREYDGLLARWEKEGCPPPDPFRAAPPAPARTFREQGEAWLVMLAERKRKPLQQSTIANRRYGLRTWLYPHLGDKALEDVNSRAVKRLVEKMVAAGLSAATVRDYVGTVKSVVASALDPTGELPLFPRKWNDEEIDVPSIDRQRQPTTTGEAMTEILAQAAGQYRVLFALLGGCGPLRAGEALGLDVGKHLSADFRTLRIQQKAKRGETQPYLKTKAGERDVDLCTGLAALLRDFLGGRREGLLFRTATGRQLLQSNVLRRKLHPILKNLGHVKGGFNIFRRFRITHLTKTECPEVLQHFWSGHAPRHISERYAKLHDERDFRLEWAERVGLGFGLPAPARKLAVVRQSA
jgi:hypothetical protein